MEAAVNVNLDGTYPRTPDAPPSVRPGLPQAGAFSFAGSRSATRSEKSWAPTCPLQHFTDSFAQPLFQFAWCFPVYAVVLSDIEMQLFHLVFSTREDDRHALLIA